MTIEHSGTTACPYCGGEIKAAARVCKHCKRSVGVAPAIGAPPPPPATSAPTPILIELRDFVVERGVARREQLDPLLAQQPHADAVVILGYLAAAGYIAPVQVESLREGFRQRQGARAATMLRAAQDRGLLTPAHVEWALVRYRDVVFQATISECLIAAGMLTPIQAAELHRSATPVGRVVVGVQAWWGGLSQTGRRVVLGLVGVQLLGMAMLGGALAVDAIRGRVDIAESATMNGWGRGTATFTNRGSRAGSLCGHVYVMCGRGSRSSASFCSGTVAPNETKHVDFSVPGTDRIGSNDRDWRDDCTFEFIRETTGD